MKINIDANPEGVIESWTSYPLRDGEPVYDVKDPYRIRLGFDRLVDGKIVRDEAGYRAEKARQAKRVRILFLKSELSRTDYKLFKHLEGSLPDGEWEEIKERRQGWRDEINRLEEELK